MGVNILGLEKSGERFVFIYDDVSREQLFQVLGRYAADPELNLDWRDAAELACTARGEEYKPPPPIKPPAIVRYFGNLWRALRGATQ